MPAIASFHPVVVAVFVLAVFVLAALAAWAGRRLLGASLSAYGVDDPEIRQAVQARARQILRGVKLLAYGSASLASALLVLSFLKPGLPAWVPRTRDDLLDLLLEHGLRIALIALAAYITVRAIHLWIEYLEYRFTADAVGPSGQERRRRARTLSGTLGSVFTAVVGFTAGVMVLQEINIDVLPILTGAGIAGLAIGFGAQNLVRDVISGFFLILEDQVRVGDIAKVQTVVGVVEQINLRTLVLRDADGAVHVFPNGTITTLANLSKEYAYAVVDLIVPVTEDFTRYRRAVCDVGERMQADPSFGPAILEPVEFMGIESIRENNVTVRARFKTLPLRQYAVAREFRWRMLTEFRQRPE